MSKSSGNKLILRLKISPSLAAVSLLLHLGALILLFPLDLPAWLLSVVGLLLLTSLYQALTRHVFRSNANAVTGLQWSEEEGLSIQTGREETLYAVAIHSRFVHRWLVLLSVTPAGRRVPMPLPIPADALGADNFRRLRVALLAPFRRPAG